MKKLAVLASFALLSLSLFATEPVTVSDKVLGAFKQSFKNVTDAVWHEHSDRFEVRFFQNEINTQITYSKDGSVLKAIRYYGQESLPLFIREKLQKEHADKKVFGITEFTTGETLNYYIVLENAATWTHVKCSAGGEMNVFKKLRKA